MGIDPSTMVSLIDQLESAGLAKRRPHPTDRRAREVVDHTQGPPHAGARAADGAEVEDEVLGGPQRGRARASCLRCCAARSTRRRRSRSWSAEEGD